jgi:hypothetical protein
MNPRRIALRQKRYPCFLPGDEYRSRAHPDRKQYAFSSCTSAENWLLGCLAMPLLEATMFTTARFPGSTRDI